MLLGGDRRRPRFCTVNQHPEPATASYLYTSEERWRLLRSQHFGNRLTNITLLLYKNTDQTLLTNKSHGPNALQNRCYMCIQWTRVLYSVVITRQCNPHISQINSLCNKLTSFWSMFVYNNGQFW